VREWDLKTRDEEMEWAEANGVPVPTTKKKPYSIDDNLWGRAIECGVLENTWNTPPADIWTMTKNWEDCPNEPETVIIGFEKGIPTSINGEKMSLLDAVIKANEIAGRNGFGRIDMIEDRVVGIKSRECYECPAALLLIQAHQTLETLCLDAETLKQKAKLDVEWASLVYRGLWYSQNRVAIDAYNAYTQQFVSGEVRIILCKGGIFVDGVRSDYALYDYNLATYDEGDTFDHSASAGFITLHGLQSKTWSKIQGPGAGHPID
jgi:argininosuccinate synthase